MITVNLSFFFFSLEDFWGHKDIYLKTNVSSTVCIIIQKFLSKYLVSEHSRGQKLLQYVSSSQLSISVGFYDFWVLLNLEQLLWDFLMHIFIHIIKVSKFIIMIPAAVKAAKCLGKWKARLPVVQGVVNPKISSNLWKLWNLKLKVL